MKIEDKTPRKPTKPRSEEDLEPTHPIAGAPQAPEAPQAPIKPWEYRVQKMPIESDLTQFGNDGWELAALCPIAFDQTMAVFHFKRQK